MGKIKDNFLYNWAKKMYYKHIFFREIPHKWKGNLVYTIYRGVRIRFLLYKVKNKGFHAPKYLNENLSTLHREVEGYLTMRDVKEGDIVFDCGAYNGAFAVYACKKVGEKGKVICIEPDENNAKILRKNLELNNCNNFEIIVKGLWSKKTELKFKSGGVGAMISPKGDIVIKTTTIDNEIKRLKIPQNKVKFIKMDVEGAEMEVIKGAKKILSRKDKPYIAVASYHIVNGEKTCHEVEKQLKKFRYKIVKTVFPKHLVTIGKND